MRQEQLQAITERHRIYYKLWLKSENETEKNEYYGFWMGIELTMKELGYANRRVNNEWVFKKTRKTSKK